MVKGQSVDSMFLSAREMAIRGDLKKASQLLEDLLSLDPEYTDATLYLARIQGWERKFLQADSLLQKIPDKQRSIEWWRLYCSLKFWQDNSSGLQERVQQALVIYPEDETIQLYKVFSKLMDNQVQDGYDLLNAKEWNLERAIELKRQLRNRLSRNYLSLLGNIDILPAVSDRYFGQVEAGIGHKGSQYLGRVVYANQFNNAGIQWELEAYPLITSEIYLFLGISYSNSILFPKYKMGVDVNWAFTHGWESSMGIRYFDFRNIRSVVFTPTLTQYNGDWMFRGRGAYVVNEGNSNNFSVSAESTRYLSSNWHHIKFNAGVGSYLPQRYSLENRVSGISYWLGTRYQFPVKDRHFISISGEYAREKRAANLPFSNRISLQAGYLYQF